jgi:Trypsin-co-occurring domain 1
VKSLIDFWSDLLLCGFNSTVTESPKVSKTPDFGPLLALVTTRSITLNILEALIFRYATTCRQEKTGRECSMANYIQFVSSDGSTMLVEVAESEMQSQGGRQKAGLKDTIGKGLAVAGTSLDDAIKHVIHDNAHAFIQSVGSLQIKPSEAAITFGLKVTGEAGNIAVGQVGGEVNYTVTLTWKRESKEQKQDEH